MSEKKPFMVGDEVTIETTSARGIKGDHLATVARVFAYKGGEIVSTDSGYRFEADGSLIKEALWNIGDLVPLNPRLIHRAPEHVAQINALALTEEIQEMIFQARRDIRDGIAPPNVAKLRDIRDSLRALQHATQ